MAGKSSSGLILAVTLAGLIGFGYYKSEQGSSAPPPAPTGSSTGGGTGRYVSLGDSYTSSPRTGVRVGEPRGCARSDNNYPRLIAARLNPAEFVDVSCSGASTVDLTHPQATKDGENPPQLDAVTSDTTLVTLGIGGNDIGFIKLAGECATTDPKVSPCQDKMDAGGYDELAARISATAVKIAAVLTEIHARAPRARVIVVGYPTALPSGDGCWPFLPLGKADVAYLRESEEKLNRMLAVQAKAHQAGYADTASPSKGHDMCAKTRVKWVEDLV
ncbi:SGNH/GDSL hydrolase family protein, partial [Amycolatopsis rhizosphaerae]